MKVLSRPRSVQESAVGSNLESNPQSESDNKVSIKSINQSQTQKAVGAAQQLVVFKKLAVARRKAAKAVHTPEPAPVPTAPAPAPTSSPNRPPRSAQPPHLEPEDLISCVAEIPEPALPSPPASPRAIHWSDPL